MKKVVFRLLLVLFSVALTLILIEIGLRFRGRTVEPVEVSLPLPVEEEPWQKMVRDQQLTAETFNIYYFGESTMKGEPYEDTIPIMVAQMLEHKVGDRELRWVNLSDRAIDLQESDRRVAWVLEYKDFTHPSLFVLYSGHNEFLKYHDCCGFVVDASYGPFIQRAISSSLLLNKIAEALRLYKLEIHDRSFFDVAVVPKEDAQHTFVIYQNLLNRIVERATNDKVPLIVSTVVANTADYQPNRSTFCEKNADAAQFQSHMDSGKKAFTAGNFQEAQMYYEGARNICNQFAETHFLLGKTYQALGLSNEAWDEFQKANDLDGMPIRVLTVQNEAIRSLPLSETTRAVDPVETFRQHSAERLIGYNLMVDGHHPNLEGYMLISQLLSKEISALTKSSEPITIPLEQLLAQFEPDDETKRHIYLERAEWFIRMSTWRYDGEDRLSRAKSYLEKVAQLGTPTAKQYILHMALSILENDKEAAEAYREKALQTNPEETEALLNNYWVGQFVQRLK